MIRILAFILCMLPFTANAVSVPRGLDLGWYYYSGTCTSGCSGELVILFRIFAPATVFNSDTFLNPDTKKSDVFYSFGAYSQNGTDPRITYAEEVVDQHAWSRTSLNLEGTSEGVSLLITHDYPTKSGIRNLAFDYRTFSDTWFLITTDNQLLTGEGMELVSEGLRELTVVPLPAALPLFGVGLLGFAALRRFRKT